jgi:hypothetical protein
MGSSNPERPMRLATAELLSCCSADPLCVSFDINAFDRAGDA